MNDCFEDEFDNGTLHDTYRKQHMCDENPIYFDAIDWDGHDEFAAMRDQWIREGDGYYIVYQFRDFW